MDKALTEVDILLRTWCPPETISEMRHAINQALNSARTQAAAGMAERAADRLTELAAALEQDGLNERGAGMRQGAWTIKELSPDPDFASRIRGEARTCGCGKPLPSSCGTCQHLWES